jgi:NDP-sugar pyrophosphorylase family protein
MLATATRRQWEVFMRGFVLAAGLGTRLRPLTEQVPKPMVAVADMPLVERAVRQLVRAGITEIGINLYYLPEMIVEHLGDGGRLGANLTYFDERTAADHGSPLGTGGGLKNAEAFLRGGGQSSFMLVNGDAWHSFDLELLARQHATNRLATMAVHVDRRRPELHLLECAADQRVLGISARPPMTVDELSLSDGVQRAIYSGVAIYDCRLLDRLPANRVSGLVTHGIQPALGDGDRICWNRPAGLWVDCGSIEELQRADICARSLRPLEQSWLT